MLARAAALVAGRAGQALQQQVMIWGIPCASACYKVPYAHSNSLMTLPQVRTFAAASSQQFKLVRVCALALLGLLWFGASSSSSVVAVAWGCYRP